MSPRRVAALTASLAACAGLGLTLAPGAGAATTVRPDPDDARLTGFASLPADTFVPGSERSGFFTGNPAAPFPGQPVQGFSAVTALPGGDYLVMSDNGFGAKANSADFQLRVHRIRPDLASGTIEVRPGGFVLADPDRRIPFTLWRDGGCQTASDAGTLPAGYTCPPRDRVLTGADLDIESMQSAPDGSLFFGDEFGPFLIHTDARGRVLEPPVATPGVRSPSNPFLAPGEQPTLAGSKGFEGMAVSPDGTALYPMLEGPVAGDPSDTLRVFKVRIDRGAPRFTDRVLRYRLDSPSNAIGDFIAVNDHQFLVLEGDPGRGATAVFKRIFLVDKVDRDRDGYLDKTLLVDLMSLPNPGRLGGFDRTFSFPYVTIEDIDLLDDQTIVVLNDNNYPGTGGRGTDVKDVNEFLRIRLPERLALDVRLLTNR